MDFLNFPFGGIYDGFLEGISNRFTPWKINMEPENDGLEDEFPFQLGGFWVPC